MGFKYNPFTGNLDIAGGGVPTYASFGSFPSTAADGSLAVALDTDSVYVFDATSNAWKLVSTPSSVLDLVTYTQYGGF